MWVKAGELCLSKVLPVSYKILKFQDFACRILKFQDLTAEYCLSTKSYLFLASDTGAWSNREIKNHGEFVRTKVERNIHTYAYVEYIFPILPDKLVQ